MGVLIMDMTDYDGPTVAVLVRKTLVGPPKVDSVHPDTNTAYEHLGCEIVAGRSPVACGWEIVTVPASPTAVGTVDVDEPQRAVDDFREELAAALEMPADIRWHILLEAVRENREALEEQDSDDALLRELRSALSPIGPRAERLNRRGLLALVRELVRAEWSGTHGELDGDDMDSPGLDRAAREFRVQAGGGMARWSEYLDQDRAMWQRRASAILNAYRGHVPAPSGAQRRAAERTAVLDGHDWADLDEVTRDDYLAQARANTVAGA